MDDDSRFVLDLSDILYERIKETVSEITTSPSVTDIILILKTINIAATLIETMKYENVLIRGHLKKKIVLKTCRNVLRDYVRPSKIESILEIYDSSSDEIIDEVINFAKNNKRIISFFKSCC